MNIGLIIIGDEILSGKRQDKHLAKVIELLSARGLSLAWSTYVGDDPKRQRTHARIEWHSGAFQLTDLSSNGTYVRFGRQSEAVTLRRGSCTLHGKGVISLGVNPSVLNAPTVTFEILRFDDTDPQPI